MRINFITRMDENYASFRYRMAIPAKALEALGHDTRISGYLHSGTQSAVLSKHFDKEDNNRIMETCNDLGVRAVFDVCDNHFESSPHKEYYHDMVKRADIVISATPELAQVIKDTTGRDSVVITDPYEFPERAPKIVEAKDSYKLLWFGHETNINGLMRVWHELKGHRIKIMTNPMISEQVKLPITPWSLEGLKAAFKSADAVIIPAIEAERSQCKSPNRAVESLRQGCFVVAHPIPSYQQFKKWIYLGNIREGLDWMREHADEIPDRVKAAQAYIRDNFAPEKIAKDWERVLC